ncbi:hypothetical protein Patl1_26567 [Pistacia atlantica]|uniref:Uncharacterized protein n=1 Tax=Pistacia atlantica TaxID=434234 RepID=A0ACC1B0J3_9ROSI|nr:hypothetical protein Patl1_26567 [Pistacia atlantica]
MTDVCCRIEIPVEFQMMSPSSTETTEEERRREEDNILDQIVLFSLFILLNSTYGMYGPGFLFKGTAFLICLIFAFTGAFCALLIGDKTQLAIFHTIYSIMSMASMSLALLIFFFELLLSFFLISSSSSPQMLQIRQRMLPPPSSQPPSSSSIDSQIQAVVVADQNYNQFLHQWKNILMASLPWTSYLILALLIEFVFGADQDSKTVCETCFLSIPRHFI